MKSNAELLKRAKEITKTEIEVDYIYTLSEAIKKINKKQDELEDAIASLKILLNQNPVKIFELRMKMLEEKENAYEVS